MESPVKKLDFGAADKENQPFDESTLADLEHQVEARHVKVVEETKKVEEKPIDAVVSTIKAQEAEEPLLMENPQRFVLFPIKYHEVRDA